MGSTLTASLRRLFRAPRLILFVVLPLALGLGANAALFTLVNRVLLTPLDIPGAGAVLSLQQLDRQTGSVGRLSAANYLDYADGSTVFDALAAWQPVELTLTGQGEPAVLSAARVTPSFFSVLGRQPERGRPFAPGDAVAAEPEGVILDHNPIVIVSHELWRARFGGRREVVGSTVEIDRQIYTLVGVMPEGFAYPREVDAWLPLVMGDVAPLDRGGYYLEALGRLRGETTLETARQEAEVLATRMRELAPRVNDQLSFSLVPLQERLVADVRVVLWILLGITALILTLIGANVAAALLARWLERQGEAAVRLATGATPGSLFRQSLVENLVLAWSASLLGWVIALGGVRLLLPLAPAGLLEAGDLDVGVELLVAAAVIGTIAGALLAAVPVVAFAARDLLPLLAAAGGRVSLSPRQRRMQSLLVVAQLALAAVLLNGASLLVRSYWQLRAVDLGFAPERLLTVDLTLPEERYRGEASRRQFASEVLGKVAALPGVSSAAVGLRLPVVDAGGGIWFAPGDKLGEGGVGGDGDVAHGATFNAVSPGYLATLGVPLLSGRGFEATDLPESLPVALISRALERRFFAAASPVGQTLTLTPWPDEPRRIVGVVDDVRQGGVRGEIVPAIYVPYDQIPMRRLRIAVRTTGASESLAARVQDGLWSVDPSLGLRTVAPMEDRLAWDLRRDRFSMWLVSAFAVLGLFLAASAIFGGAMLFVSQRRADLSLRIALGAQPWDVLRLVLRWSLIRTATGLAIGVLTALLLVVPAASVLFEVGGADPLALVTTTMLLLATVALGTYLPARRAVSVDPARELRRA